MDPKDHIIFPLDVPHIDEAAELVDQLFNDVGSFKAGLEFMAGLLRDIMTLPTEDADDICSQARSLFSAIGPKLFCDGKFKDIPSTVAGAAKAVAGLGVLMFNVHASGGVEMMRAAVANKGNSLVLAVTVLTSMDEEECKRSYGGNASARVLEYAMMALEAGVDGIICSPKELLMLKSCDALYGLKYVTPGVRPEWASADDQKRVMTPGEAIKAGADYLVIGRPIRKPPKDIGSPVEAAKRIADEIETALQVQEAQRRG